MGVHVGQTEVLGRKMKKQPTGFYTHSHTSDLGVIMMFSGSQN